jgi:hypothetical protein
MSDNISIHIYRRLDNRIEGLPDDSPRALELHNRRKEALHEILDQQELVKVESWGDTNDEESHELITIILSAAASALTPIVIAGLQEVGKKLAEKAVDETTSSVVKWVISKFSKKQKEKKLLDFTIILKDGKSIHVDTPENITKITINTSGDQTVIEYQS